MDAAPGYEKKLGVKVNAFFAPDTRALSRDALNKVDIAWYGTRHDGAVDRANGCLRPDGRRMIAVVDVHRQQR